MPSGSGPSKKRRNKSGVGVPGLSLTSMMDMLTTILLFLLKSYSSEGEIVTSDPRLKLPVSISTQAPRPRLLVQISIDDIIVDGVRVAGVEESVKSKDFLIKPMHDELNKHAKRAEFIAMNNPDVKFTGEVLVQGDKSIPFALLEKIMFTCGQAGYNGISLAVTSSGD
jgi:biopolymer transport protein ExbD